MYARIGTETTLQTYQFDRVEDAREFYAGRVESVDDGNTLGVQFRHDDEEKQYGLVMTDKQPIRVKVVRCSSCRQFQPYYFVWDGLCEVCEDGSEALLSEYEEHEAFFNTKKKAELFHKGLKGKSHVAALKRPFAGLNPSGEDCWTVVYMTFKKRARSAA